MNDLFVQLVDQWFCWMSLRKTKQLPLLQLLMIT